MGKRKPSINTFNRKMTLEEAEREKVLGTPVGEDLLKADREYEKRRRLK
jgi:hypothetical protein